MNDDDGGPSFNTAARRRNPIGSESPHKTLVLFRDLNGCGGTERTR